MTTQSSGDGALEMSGEGDLDDVADLGEEEDEADVDGEDDDMDILKLFEESDVDADADADSDGGAEGSSGPAAPNEKKGSFGQPERAAGAQVGQQNSHVSVGAAASSSSAASSIARPSLRQAPVANLNPNNSSLADVFSGDEGENNDSDFDSSDVENILMRMGQTSHSTPAGEYAERLEKRQRRRLKMLADKDKPAEPAQKRARKAETRSSKVCQDLRGTLEECQDQYLDGNLEEALRLCQEIVRSQPGFADAYHVLALIQEGRGDASKALQARLLAAYFTPTPENAPIWRQVADTARKVWEETKSARELSLAIYAYKRSLNSLKADPEENGRILVELSQLYQKQGQWKKGAEALVRLYDSNRQGSFACEAARFYMRLHDWSNCKSLLERVMKTPTVEVEALDLYCSVLIELREYRKCSQLICDRLRLPHFGSTLLQQLGPSGTGGKSKAEESQQGQQESAIAVSPLDPATLLERLRSKPIGLIAKLAAAACRIGIPESVDEALDPLQQAAMTVVLEKDPSVHHVHHLELVRALLSEKSTEDPQQKRASRIATFCIRAAQLAMKILDKLLNLPSLPASIDLWELKEFQALCHWKLGHGEEAGKLMEEALELAETQKQPKVVLRRLRVEVAEIWMEQGSLDQVESALRNMSYDEMKEARYLPPALSTEQRLKLYDDLTLQMEGILGKASNRRLSPEEFQDFSSRFRSLVFDIELDYVRLARQSSRSEQPKQKQAPEEAKAGGASKSASGAGKEDQSGSFVINFPTTRGSRRRIPADRIVQNPWVNNKTKRRHMGTSSIEDKFGFESYASFILHGIEVTQLHAFPTDDPDWNFGREEALRTLELCEMFASGKRVDNMKDPVKRPYLQKVMQASAGLASRLRLWRVVFKFLRARCAAAFPQEDESDQGNRERDFSDHALALLARVLFFHSDVVDGGDSARDRWRSASAHGQRYTYAATVSDAKSWILRQLALHPHSWALNLLAGHFSTLAASYKHALGQYLRAHKLKPKDWTGCLCAAVAYISFAMSRNCVDRHGTIIKGMAMFHQYEKLRLQDTASVLEEVFAKEPKAANSSSGPVSSKKLSGRTRLTQKTKVDNSKVAKAKKAKAKVKARLVKVKAKAKLAKVKAKAKIVKAKKGKSALPRASTSTSTTRSPTKKGRAGADADAAVDKKSTLEEDEDEDEEVLTRQLNAWAQKAEAEYNKARFFHQLGQFGLAAELYHSVLDRWVPSQDESFKKAPKRLLLAAERRVDLQAVRRSSAYNLAHIYKGQGSDPLAHEVLWQHMVF